MIYKGNTLINDIYVGSTKIGEVYKGSTLVSGYPSGTVLFESGVPGTYTINVKYKSVVHIDLCGSGGAGATSLLGSRGMTGGSAGYIYGDLFLVAGSYEITVASPSSNASSFNGNIIPAIINVEIIIKTNNIISCFFFSIQNHLLTQYSQLYKLLYN